MQLNQDSLKAAGSKIGKPKHNIKLHLWNILSRRGMTRLVIFEVRLDKVGFQKIIVRGLVPFINEEYLKAIVFFQDDDPKNTSDWTQRFK